MLTYHVIFLCALDDICHRRSSLPVLLSVTYVRAQLAFWNWHCIKNEVNIPRHHQKSKVKTEACVQTLLNEMNTIFVYFEWSFLSNSGHFTAGLGGGGLNMIEHTSEVELYVISATMGMSHPWKSAVMSCHIWNKLACRRIKIRE